MKFAACVFRCFNPSTTKLELDAASEEVVDCPTIPQSNLRVFSYEELKAATQGFKNKIGEGGFGSVYKGRFSGNDSIAVKVLSVEPETMRGEREFISEIAALSDIKHENLGEQKRAKFTWTLRKHVSLGIARGLCYLHEEVNPHIVHRDIKPSNILIDRDFTPKVADFGLARLFRDNISYISTRVAGTLGYLSPEYAHSGHLTRKSDVYSFGVLLLEIVSGHPVVDYHVQYGEQYLVEKAWEMYSAKNLLELVDTELKGEFSEEEAIRFLKVGLLCVQKITRLRPSMCAAIKMMKNEIDIQDVEISQPGLVADLMEVKIRLRQSSNFTSSSPASSSTGSFHAR